MTGQSALLLGATGGTGKHVLKELLLSPHFTQVGEYGRRVTSIEQIESGKEKLEQKTIDFEKLEEAGLNARKWDVVFITLGTTRSAAGSAAAFEKIDREYVINAARAAKSDDPNYPQRLVYVSAGNANPKSSLLYPKSKGLTELGLAGLGYSDTICFRPGYLKGERDERKVPAPVESVVNALTGVLSLVSPSIEILLPVLGKSVRIAGQLGSSALPPAAEASEVGEDTPFTVISNKGAVALAKTDV